MNKEETEGRGIRYFLIGKQVCRWLQDELKRNRCEGKKEIS